jgi:hypothetical protein
MIEDGESLKHAREIESDGEDYADWQTTRKTNPAAALSDFITA